MSRFALIALICLGSASVSAQSPEMPLPVNEPPVVPPAPPTPEPTSPRIVVVVRGGDPSADVVEAATVLEDSLASSGLRIPSDSGMRTVLRGGVPEAPEGYEPARAARLRLGWSPEGDREALVGIARFVEADAVVVVTGTQETITVEVFDPGAGDFYEGAASISVDDPSPAVPFVRSRVRAAFRRRVEPAAVARTAAPVARPRGADLSDATEPAAPATEPRWIRRNWPIILASVLLAGTVTFFVVSRRNDGDTSPPTIHITPGGN